MRHGAASNGVTRRIYFVDIISNPINVVINIYKKMALFNEVIVVLLTVV